MRHLMGPTAQSEHPSQLHPRWWTRKKRGGPNVGICIVLARHGIAPICAACRPLGLQRSTPLWRAANSTASIIRVTVRPPTSEGPRSGAATGGPPEGRTPPASHLASSAHCHRCKLTVHEVDRLRGGGLTSRRSERHPQLVTLPMFPLTQSGRITSSSIPHPAMSCDTTSWLIEGAAVRLV